MRVWVWVLRGWVGAGVGVEGVGGWGLQGLVQRSVARGWVLRVCVLRVLRMGVCWGYQPKWGVGVRGKDVYGCVWRCIGVGVYRCGGTEGEGKAGTIVLGSKHH